ncbi:flagellar motor switch protein FliN [Planococcus salinarum]|uniref:Flagellar motor switch protein FliN n=1 Tax=Planococcus salinarum TaxID=622695 RepID=A0ABX3D1B3_9BACL|nr:flagellar motor switch phosphatase FliY [Planococcus salinarum]OHX53393.1 flagellar motor switch protein FliN [Planococcus salinarum]TAA72208.1 flagellar motor switch phosphatase FliY [Planococcus salinarum]
MVTGNLSSDEINGLLNRSEKEVKKMANTSLSTIESEALTELFSVALGSSSAVLSLLLSEQVTVSAPKLAVKPETEMMAKTQAPFFVLLGEYTGDISGIQFVSINKEQVQELAAMVDPEIASEDTERQFEILQDIMQQMYASVSRTFSALLESEISHSLSGMDMVEQREDFPAANFTKEEWFVEAAFQLKAQNGQHAEFHMCIPVRLAKQMAGILTDSGEEEELEETQDMQFDSNNERSKKEQPAASPSIQPVQFSSFDDSAAANTEPNNLSMLMDIPLQVTVELGRTKRTVKEILGVSQGSIIELDKLAGEPVDILVNDKLIAVGEVVVIDENFGVRVTDILSTEERISKLR